MLFSKCTKAVEGHDEHQKADSLKKKCKKITTFYHFVREGGLYVLQKELGRQLSNPTARGPSVSRLLL